MRFTRKKGGSGKGPSGKNRSATKTVRFSHKKGSANNIRKNLERMVGEIEAQAAAMRAEADRLDKAAAEVRLKADFGDLDSLFLKTGL